MGTVRVFTYDRSKADEDKAVIGVGFVNGEIVIYQLDGSALSSGPLSVGITLNSEGDWDNLTEYEDGTMVNHSGQTWICTADTSAGEEPGVDAVWVPLLVANDLPSDVVRAVPSTRGLSWTETKNTTAENPISFCIIEQPNNGHGQRLNYRASGYLMNNTGADRTFYFRLIAAGEGAEHDILTEFPISVPFNSPSATHKRPFILEAFIEMDNIDLEDDLSVYGTARCQVGSPSNTNDGIMTTRIKSLLGVGGPTSMLHDNVFRWTVEMAVASNNLLWTGRASSAERHVYDPSVM